MLIWLAISLGMIAVATRVRVSHSRRVEAAIAAQRKHLIDDLERATGLTVHGDILGAFSLRGTLHGVDFSLANSELTTLPGPSSELRSCALVELRAAIPDMVVCTLGDVDAVMGAIPSVPRTPTGDTMFDSVYAVFAAPPTGEATGDFRTSPAADALAWAKPEVLRQWLAQGILWFRARGGACQMAGAPTGPKRAHQILTVAANVSRAVAGQPLVEMPEALPSEMRVQKLMPIVTIAFVGTAAGVLVSLVPIFLFPLRGDGQMVVAMMVCSAGVYFCWVLFSFARWARPR